MGPPWIPSRETYARLRDPPAPLRGRGTGHRVARQVERPVYAVAKDIDQSPNSVVVEEGTMRLKPWVLGIVIITFISLSACRPGPNCVLSYAAAEDHHRGACQFYAQ